MKRIKSNLRNIRYLVVETNDGVVVYDNKNLFEKVIKENPKENITKIGYITNDVLFKMGDKLTLRLLDKKDIDKEFNSRMVIELMLEITDIPYKNTEKDLKELEDIIKHIDEPYNEAFLNILNILIDDYMGILNDYMKSIEKTATLSEEELKKYATIGAKKRFDVQKEDDK